MVRSDDLELAAEAFGNPLDAPLLLIMGVGGSMLLWPAAFCEKLASRGFYVFRYDNRDTGRSTFWPPGAPDYGVDELADDAISILDAFGVPRAHIVGLSMGGIVGQIAALAHPNRMLSLTLISSIKALDAETLAFQKDGRPSSRCSRHSRALRPAHSRCHQFVTR
jgi:pimeloyl-ACP methyl ester carboxylesterase